MFVFGVVLFAVCIGVSVMLHEAGHMYTAKAFGMKVSRYFVGFGPTLFSFHRGETEYGLKAIPAGGFCAIEGMNPLEESDQLGPDEAHRAFYRGKLWKRTIVLAAGSITHFLLAILIIYVGAMFAGLPNPAYADAQQAALTKPDAQPAYAGVVQKCLPDYPTVPTAADQCPAGAPVSPASQAGMVAGDRVTRIGATPVSTWGDLTAATKSLKEGATSLTYSHDGTSKTVPVTVRSIKHATGGTKKNPTVVDTPLLGVSLGLGPIPLTKKYNPATAIGPTASLTGQLVTGTFGAIGKVPGRIPDLFRSLAGQQRDPQGLISVVGASRLGGDAVAIGGDAGIVTFLLLLASLNVFIGIFNLFPLLPLDGGHIAIAYFERVRSWWARRRGRPNPGFVNPAKLVPTTLAFVAVFGSLAVLVVLVDIINPVSLTG